jgi:hypothetical protein
MLWRQGKAYSQGLRERVLADAADGARVGQIAAVRQRALCVQGSQPSATDGRDDGVAAALSRATKLTDLYPAIRTEVAFRPDATIAELRTWLSTEHKVSVSNGLTWATLRKLDLRLKKVAPGGGAGPSRCRQSTR